MKNAITYRAYCFTNMYLSQIQRGIQSAHALVEMCQRVQSNGCNIDIINEWSNHHKAMIVLNGGTCSDLKQLHSEFVDVQDWFNLPLSKFEEDESLNGAITCVSVILPSFIYDTLDSSRSFEMRNRVNALPLENNYTMPIEIMEYYEYDAFINLNKKIKQYKLA